jgi:hypothetical protein
MMIHGGRQSGRRGGDRRNRLSLRCEADVKMGRVVGDEWVMRRREDHASQRGGTNERHATAGTRHAEG